MLRGVEVDVFDVCVPVRQCRCRKIRELGMGGGDHRPEVIDEDDANRWSEGRRKQMTGEGISNRHQRAEVIQCTTNPHPGARRAHGRAEVVARFKR
jgi:hypothetical protein